MYTDIGAIVHKVKKTAFVAVFFREGISFLWGIAKNYIMYWGVTHIIIAWGTPFDHTQDTQIL